MPLHRQTVVGDLVVEEVPPPADKPQLSPGRTYWWNGDAWVPARTNADAQAVLTAELAEPLIAPLPPQPKAPVAPLKRIAVPVPLEEVTAAAQPEPEEEQTLPDIEWHAAPVSRPAGVAGPEQPELAEVRFPFLAGLDKAGLLALLAAAGLCWVPRAGGLAALVLALVALVVSGFRPSRLAVVAAAVAIPELVVGLLLHAHAGSVAAAKAHNLEVLQKSLENAAQFEVVTHTYESRYGGPIALGQHGWTKDPLIEFTDVKRNGYCLTATREGVTMTIRADSPVSDVPC
ncbi:MAG: hypothetical protein JWO22_3963 [Frankiales bacterium]|nr:hypothetical protein [Frankiales bacterium]